MLARRVGVRRIALVEDAVQSALMAALRTWTEQDLPDDPGAWLYKAAYNRLIQDLRQESGGQDPRARGPGSLQSRGRIGRPVLSERDKGRHAAHVVRVLRRRDSAEITAGAGVEDAVRLQHSGDCAAALHVRGERAQASGACARPTAGVAARRRNSAARDAPLTAGRCSRGAVSPFQRRIPLCAC